MRLLDAAVAFAICIAGFATIVTVLIEILHRVLRLRAKGLREMLETFYLNVVIPETQRQLAKAKAAGLVDKVVGASGRALSAVAGHDFIRLDKEERARMSAWIEEIMTSPLQRNTTMRWYVDGLSDANKLSTEDFLGRIKETALFREWADGVKARSEAALAKFAGKYEEYCSAMSDYFGRRAQVLSLAVGIALAVCANIDGIRLFERFLSDPALANKIEAQSAELQKALKTSQEAKGQPSDLEGLQKAADRVNDLAALYAEMQLPIGWTQYPGCTRLARGVPGRPAGEKCDTFARVVESWQQDKRAFLTWLFAVVLTGTLIGLGGPFWFDVAKKIAAVRDSVKGSQDAHDAAPAGRKPAAAAPPVRARAAPARRLVAP